MKGEKERGFDRGRSVRGSRCVREDDGGGKREERRERSKAEPVTHTDGATRDTNDAERRFPAECTAAAGA